MPKILAVAHGEGPSETFTLLAEENAFNGNMALWTGHGRRHIDARPMAEGIRVVVSGVARDVDFAGGEMSACYQARERGLPFGLYLDTWNIGRAHRFKGMRRKVAFLFVLTEEEKRKMAEIFPKANIVVTGNPLWERCAFSTKKRDDVRTELGAVESDSVVVCPLRREYHLNWPSLGILKTEIERCPPLFPILPVFVIHPKDETFRGNPHTYDYFLPQKRRIIVDTKAAEILPGADLVIGMAEDASMEAIYLRIPVVELLTSSILEELARVHHKKAWQPVDEEAAFGAYDSSQLQNALRKYLRNSTERDWMIKQQKRFYPIPPCQSHALGIMATHLSSFL